jgi:hypothetical protein
MWPEAVAETNRQERMEGAQATDRVVVEVNLPPGGPLSGMAADVRAGLTCPFKEVSPRYFYDERGSKLFEEITRLPEYYPTRCERAILEARSAEIVAAAEPQSLIELGSGSASKTRVLLDAMSAAGCLETYCPVDISEQITRETAERIADEYPGVEVHGVVCDFELDLERIPVGAPRTIALLGGTIGNFEPQQRAAFLRRVANLLGSEDRFLLRPRLLRAPRLLGSRQPLDGHPAAIDCPPDRERLRPRPPGQLRGGRGDEDGDLDQVRPPRAGGDLRRSGARDDRVVDRPRRPVRAQPRQERLEASR